MSIGGKGRPCESEVNFRHPRGVAAEQPVLYRELVRSRERRFRHGLRNVIQGCTSQID
jgi:hypothetical protein